MKTPYVILKNISYDNIDQKYRFLSYKDKNVSSSFPNKTIITDIKKESSNHSFSFVNEAKTNVLLTFTMKDFLTHQKLPEKTCVNCWWCRHSFDYRPIGCPIEYKLSNVSKKYYSEITKSNYILSESISNRDYGKNEEFNNFFTIEKKLIDHFISDGIFCSFPCVKAYILEMRKTNQLYDQSESLLNLIYMKLYNTSDIKIEPAPDWKLLKAYGGPLSIEEYRKDFKRIKYIHNDNDHITSLPSFLPLGNLYEKKIKL